MDIAQWRQIPDSFGFDLLSDDVGYFWTPEADAEGAHDKANYSIHNVREDHKSRVYSLITHSSIPLDLALVQSRLHHIPAEPSFLIVKDMQPQATITTWRQMIVEGQETWAGHDFLCNPAETLL
jgi:hypothetical protein